ncbi:MAG: glycosyltransferase family 2 protein [Deltaproteobacteria bacterium]
MNSNISIIFNWNNENPDFVKTLNSIENQTYKDYEIIALSDKVIAGGKIRIVNTLEKSYARSLNEAVKIAEGEFILLIDNKESTVSLKHAALEAFLIAAERNPSSGLFYTDYELLTGNTIIEKKLLFHHIGRVRDNQDYGKVYFIRKEALLSIGGFDENVKYNTFYDMRLKISEHFTLTRISNKFSGSFYSVKASDKKANVFDYLLAGKDIQIEAENILTRHLQRIGACMKPFQLMPVDYKVEDDNELKASIIIPVGFRPEFIGTAVESIQAQTVQDIEAIIVVNGGEIDPTAEVVREYMNGGNKYNPQKPEIRLIVVDINNIGLCLNIGANNARGKYYVQLDSDDRLKPDAVEKILKVYDSDPGIGMVIGSYEVWEKKDDGSFKRLEEIPVVTHDEWTDENGRNNLLRINGAGAPRSLPIEVIKQMGYFSVNDDEFARNYGEDYEMVLKVSEYYRIGRVWDPIYEVVRHSGGTDHSISEDLIMRNDEAKDDIRKHAIMRRMAYNSIKN